jgi:uncharacterized Zn-finger protein
MKETAKKESPKGFACQCGKEHVYPPYVFAHWDEQLFFTCPGCAQKYKIIRGRAIKVGRKEQRHAQQ